MEKTLESPLDCKEIQPVYSKGNQSWTFIERTDAEAEDAILWPPNAQSWLIGEDPGAGQDWRHEQKGMTDCIINSMDMSLSKLQDLVQTRNSGVVQSMGSLSVRHDRETEQQQILREGGCIFPCSLNLIPTWLKLWDYDVTWSKTLYTSLTKNWL